jgi:DNA invertase Pin-like site-specific DNA recombinase
MTEPQAIAIYARISQDREGDGLGVLRQLADCRAEAERRGWNIAEEYVDDDISAYSGRERPGYEQMLRDLASGSRDGVIVWHLDRLHRRPIELEEFVQVCTRAGVNHVVTLHGDFNLGSGDGLLVARLLAAVAANESDSKRRRGKRKALEVAQAGKPHMGGGFRPFGYKPDRVTVDAVEAQTLLAIAERVLAGESLPSVCRWLEETGSRTSGGKLWRPQVLRSVLLNPRYQGLRTYNGEVLGAAQWPAIFPPGMGDRLQALLTDPKRRTNRAARRYLLSGMCRCCKCGGTMYSMMRYETRRYLCRSGPGFNGCGGITITAEPIEEIIAEAVLYRLDTQELEDAMNGRALAAPHTTALQAAVDADVGQLEELAQLYADRTITATEWVQARKTIEDRLGHTRKRLVSALGVQDAFHYVGQGTALRSQWPSLNLDRQRAIVKAVLDHVIIHPGRPGVRWVDPQRAQPIWRI